MVNISMPMHTTLIPLNMRYIGKGQSGGIGGCGELREVGVSGEHCGEIGRKREETGDIWGWRWPSCRLLRQNVLS